jgi:hypothetical protein
MAMRIRERIIRSCPTMAVNGKIGGAMKVPRPKDYTREGKIQSEKGEVANFR